MPSKTIINTQAVYTEGDSSKIPVVFVHGFLFDHTMWQAQIDILSKDYYCISYDLRGFGASYVGDGQFTLDSYSSDLFSIVTELNLIRPVLCGLSLGGYIVLRTLERDQSRFRGTVLCNTKAEADSDKIKLERAKKIDEINLNGLENYSKEFFKTCFSEDTYKEKPKMIENLAQAAVKNNPRGVKGGLFAMMSRTDTNHFLPEINIPSLIIAGEKDQRSPAANMKEMAGKIKGSVFTEIENAGHLSPLEQPEKVTEAIRKFLSAF